MIIIEDKPILFANFYLKEKLKSDVSRWKISDSPNEIEDRKKLGWTNGEMWLSYRLININYYLEDGVPYGDTIKFQKAIRIGD